QRVLRETGSPGFVEPLLERSALVGPVLVIVRRGHQRADASQMRWRGDGGQHLRRADIGAAEHSNFSVGIGQGGGPLNRVVAVAGLVHERRPVAARCVAPARVLNDYNVTPLRSLVASIGAARLVVRSSLQEDGELTLRRRTKNVGPEHDAIAHRYGYVTLDDDFRSVRSLGRADESTEQNGSYCAKRGSYHVRSGICEGRGVCQDWGAASIDLSGLNRDHVVLQF